MIPPDIFRKALTDSMDGVCHLAQQEQMDALSFIVHIADIENDESLPVMGRLACRILIHEFRAVLEEHLGSAKLMQLALARAHVKVQQTPIEVKEL